MGHLVSTDAELAARLRACSSAGFAGANGGRSRKGRVPAAEPWVAPLRE